MVADHAPVGLFVKLRTLCVLGKQRQIQQIAKRRYPCLPGPDPRRPQIEPFAVQMQGYDPPAKAVARLDKQKIMPRHLQAMGKRKAGQATTDDQG